MFREIKRELLRTLCAGLSLPREKGTLSSSLCPWKKTTRCRNSRSCVSSGVLGAGCFLLALLLQGTTRLKGLLLSMKDSTGVNFDDFYGRGSAVLTHEFLMCGGEALSRPLRFLDEILQRRSSGF